MFSFVARVANESLSQVVIHNRWILLLSEISPQTNETEGRLS